VKFTGRDQVLGDFCNLSRYELAPRWWCSNKGPTLVSSALNI